MDSKQEKAFMPDTFLRETAFEDPKITRIDEHLYKRQQDNTKTPVNSEFNNTETVYTSEQSLTCHPAFEKKRQEYQEQRELEMLSSPDHIFTRTQEELEKDITTLEQQILDKIQSGMPADENIPQEELQDIENLPASQIQEELQQITTRAFAEPEPQVNDEDFTAIKSWLEETPPRKEGLSAGKILMLSMCTATAGVLIGALIVIFLLPVLNNSKPATEVSSYDQKVESAYQAYIASRDRSWDQKQGASDTSPKKNRGNGTGSNNNGTNGTGGGNGGKIAGAGLAVSIPATGISEECRTEPEIKLTPVPAGKTDISISSECHANQKVQIEYAESRITATLDGDGKHSYVLDCYAGDKQNIRFVFADKKTITRKPVTMDLDKFTKIALIWTGNIDLNLHAFEYMANKGDTGHIWEKHPSDLKKAEHRTRQSGKGHGFLDSYRAKLADDTNLEVYTFVNTPRQKQGVIKLALNHEVKKLHQQNPNCLENSNITVDYTTTLLINNKSLKTGKAASVLSLCNRQQTMNSHAIQDLIIGR